MYRLAKCKTYCLATVMLLVMTSLTVCAEEQTTKPLPAADIKTLAAKIKKSVVTVTFTGRRGGREGLGTGFIISADGLIATNMHVIGEARPITVRLADGRTFPVEQIHASDRKMDLAILKIAATNLPALPLADSDKLKQGEFVIVIGNPLGFQHSVVTGVVSGRREIDGKPMIQLAVPIERGNSGGPLLDRDGRVHGIITLKSQVTQNLGFAVAVNSLKPLLNKPNPIPMKRWLTIGALNPKEWQPLFGANWRQRAGRIHVSGRGKGFGGRSLNLSQQELPARPFEVAVDVRIDESDGAAGLVFHSDGKQKHYGFYPSSGKVRFSRFDGPDVYSWKVLREISTPYYRPGEWNQLKIRFDKDDTIQCFINEQLILKTKEDKYKSGNLGLAKFRHTTAEFRRFRIADKIPSREPQPETVEYISRLVAEISTSRPPAGKLVQELTAKDQASPLVLRQRAKNLEQQAERLRQLAKLVQQQSVRQKLAAMFKQPAENVDVLLAALLLAKLDNPEIETEAYMRQVDAMVADIRQAIKQQPVRAIKPGEATGSLPSAEQKTLQALNHYLFAELGFHGSRHDYYNRSNSYLNEVIDDREGLPITLSVLYIEMARRLNLNIVGVGLPGHYVVRFEPTQGEHQIIDVFDAGRVLTREQAAAKAKDITGFPLQEADLKSQNARQIILRMIQNLMGVARDENDPESMLAYVETALAIDVESAQYRWFRAVLRFQTGRLEAALTDADWLIEREPAGINLRQVREFRQMLQSQLP